MDTLTIRMNFQSEKKHSIRYDAADDNAEISSVYISKRALTSPYPKELIVTVSEPVSG